jgi:hypothetical protein
MERRSILISFFSQKRGVFPGIFLDNLKHTNIVVTAELIPAALHLETHLVELQVVRHLDQL